MCRLTGYNRPSGWIRAVRALASRLIFLAGRVCGLVNRAFPLSEQEAIRNIDQLTNVARSLSNDKMPVRAAEVALPCASG